VGQEIPQFYGDQRFIIASKEDWKDAIRGIMFLAYFHPPKLPFIIPNSFNKVVNNNK
jgi:hypothetical protein